METIIIAGLIVIFISVYLYKRKCRKIKMSRLIGTMRTYDYREINFNGHEYLLAYIPGQKSEEPLSSKLEKKLKLNLDELPEHDAPFSNVDLYNIQQTLLVNPHINLLNLLTEPYSIYRRRGLYKIVRLK